MKLESIIIGLLGVILFLFAAYHGVTVQKYENRLKVLRVELEQKNEELAEAQRSFERTYDSLKLRIEELEDSARSLARQRKALRFSTSAPGSLVELKDSLERFNLSLSIRDTFLCMCLKGGQRVYFAFDSLRVFKKKVDLFSKSLQLCESEKRLLRSYVDSLRTKATLFQRSWSVERKKRAELELRVASLRRERNFAIGCALVFLGVFLLK